MARHAAAIGRLRWCESSIEALNRGVEVHRMTTETKGGLGLFEQIVGHRTVGSVAEAAVLIDRGMFEHERSFLVGMTTKAKLLAVDGEGEVGILPVKAMAVLAGYLAFSDRVV